MSFRMRWWNARDSNSSFVPMARHAHHSGHSGRKAGVVARPAHILKEHVMWINTPHARLAVGDRRGLRLNTARGTLLRTVKGTLWVTIDNDPRDIVLDSGESFVVDSDRPLFVMALGDRATLDVCTDSLLREPATPPRHPWLAGLWSRQPAGAVAQVGLRGTAAA
jgi:hypothetical protein